MHQKCCESLTCVMWRHSEDLYLLCIGDIQNYSTSPTSEDRHKLHAYSSYDAIVLDQQSAVCLHVHWEQNKAPKG